MTEKKNNTEVEGLVAVVLGVAFVGWLIAAPLSGWVQSVKDALGRFLGLLVAMSHVAVWLIPLAVFVGLFVALLARVWFPRRASDVLVKLLSLEEERPRIRRVWRRGACWGLAWKMPVGVTSEKVLEQRTAVEQALDCSLRACWYERGLVRAEFGVARLPQRLSWRDFRRRVERRTSGMELPVLLGASRIGPLVVDLAELPHMLIGGSTGGGKSTLLRQAITGLVVRYDASALQLVLVDMKGGMEFNTFEGLPHLMCDVVSDVEDAEIELGRVLQEVERRQGLMRSAHAKSLREWNAKFPADRLPYIVVVVDEFAQFRAADAAQGSDERKGRQAVAARWQEIGRTGRALGVHVIACTQRPDAETITPQFKAQFAGKVAFFCADEANSRVVLDEAAAAALPPPLLTRGRAIWKGQTADLVEFQVPYLSDEEAVRLLTPRYAPAAATVLGPDFGAGPEAADDQSEEAA